MKVRICCQSGFSLIELAIVMIIIGALMVPIVDRYKLYLLEEKRDKTAISLNAVNEALGAEAQADGLYPCPADRTIPFGTPGHGEAVPNCLTAVAPGSCSAGGGICHSPGGSMLGGIPYVTLGIPYSTVMDGFGNYLNYAVSDAYVDPARANDATRRGALTLNTRMNGGNTAQTELIYGLISPGENGKGSFNTNGTQGNDCSVGTADQENCDNDPIFERRDIVYADNNDYFDDILSFSDSLPTALWVMNGPNIRNTNPGSIGIGTANPDPNVRVDVNGDVRATNFRATEFCDATGANCMRTNVIAGNITRCDPGEYLVGIANNQPICRSMSVNVTQRTCPAGQFVTAIVNGNIQCATPTP